MGMPTYEKLRHPVGRQPFAADEGGKRPGNPCLIVSIGMPTYVAVYVKSTQNVEEPEKQVGLVEGRI